MKKTSIVFTIIAASVILLNSCYRDSEEGLYRFVPANCDTTNVTYSGIIAPIVSGNCLGSTGSCHSNGTSFPLDTYTNLKSEANNLVGRITGVSGNIMPQSGRMDACKINQIKAWVNKGAPQN
ncbi:MAG: hypothetical protein HXX18_14305 [Bacteroidetes bacterium]|nr:hypothetical protein [Bacteroidota bacterium]